MQLIACNESPIFMHVAVMFSFPTCAPATACAAHPFKHCHRSLVSSQLIEFNESPIFMLLDTTISALRKDLPVTLFETGVGALVAQQQGRAVGAV